MKSARGQALTEMLLAIPLLALMAFGTVQFAAFLSARTAFERACAQAARQYALGAFPGNPGASGFEDSLWEALGSYGRLFDRSSLRIESDPLASQAAAPFQAGFKLLPGPIALLMGQASGALLNYGGRDWTVSLRYRGLPLSGLFFADGVPVTTSLAVLRHPAGSAP